MITASLDILTDAAITPELQNEILRAFVETIIFDRPQSRVILVYRA
ncbi:MAG: hypothetical protein LUC50_02705 [Ruminococcus sp.]|nr:hypothetical protein [Ruminococcus sp.]